MAITKPAKRSKSDDFVAAAPDARPARKMRGRKALISLTLAPELIDRVDTLAQREDRSRAWMIGNLLEQALAAVEAINSEWPIEPVDPAYVGEVAARYRVSFLGIRAVSDGKNDPLHPRDIFPKHKHGTMRIGQQVLKSDVQREVQKIR